MSDAAIVLTSVVKRFGAKLAVDAVSFSVRQGECFGLIGPNGAGKTTTFSMLCGYLMADAGELRVMGQNPASPGALKGKVGALPQDAVLPPGVQVGQLLSFWAKLSGVAEPETEARSVLDKVGLADTWKVRANALSHGMAKRVAMAQALIGSPPLVLLDEPTAGLDPRIAAQIRQIIRDMKGKQTVVVSSHNLQELEELCDGAAILDRGRLAQAGPMSELTSAAAEFRIQIARGSVPLGDLRGQPGCSGASLEPSGVLTVLYDGKTVPAEEMITRTLKLLIERDVFITSVTRGKKLEERVLQLT